MRKIMFAVILFFTSCAGSQIVTDTIVVEKETTKEVFVTSAYQEDLIEELYKEIVELRKYDARIVCGPQCRHRGVPWTE